jgi:hypothetical protein
MYTIHKRRNIGEIILIRSDVRGRTSRDVLGLWEDDCNSLFDQIFAIFFLIPNLSTLKRVETPCLRTATLGHNNLVF